MPRPLDKQLASECVGCAAFAWNRGPDGISTEVQAAFLDQRGVTEWNSPHSDWPARGTEQAAEVIAWGLKEAPTSIPTRVAAVGPQDYDSLAESFELLTGRVPLWFTDGSRPNSGACSEL